MKETNRKSSNTVLIDTSPFRALEPVSINLASKVVVMCAYGILSQISIQEEDTTTSLPTQVTSQHMDSRFIDPNHDSPRHWRRWQVSAWPKSASHPCWSRAACTVCLCSSLQRCMILTSLHLSSEFGVSWLCCCAGIVLEPIRKRAHTLVRLHSATVVSARWATVDWSWPKEWN